MIIMNIRSRIRSDGNVINCTIKDEFMPHKTQRVFNNCDRSTFSRDLINVVVIDLPLTSPYSISG